MKRAFNINNFRRKGSIVICTLFFITMSITLLGFAFDIARIMYFKSYTRHLASVIALSMVNECGHLYYDSENGARVVIVSGANVRPKDYKGKYYANIEYAQELLKLNKVHEIKSYKINNGYIAINPQMSSFNPYMPQFHKVDYDEFVYKSKDGINGQVDVHITAEIEMFFLKSLYNGKKIIHENAIAQPRAEIQQVNDGKLREEQLIEFVW